MDHQASGTLTLHGGLLGVDAEYADFGLRSSRQVHSGGSVPLIASSNLLLRSLPARLFETLRGSLRTVYLSKEQYVWHQGDELDYVYFPETAVVSEFRMLPDGRTAEIMMVGREGACGISMLFCPTALANCTQVIKAGSASRIPTYELLKISRSHSELAGAFTASLETYIKQISQKAICNAYHGVEERLCTWLLMLDDRCGPRTLKLTHDQMARIIGVHRPSLTRITMEMRKKDLIGYSRGGITILDRKTMEESACSCYFEMNCIDNSAADPSHLNLPLNFSRQN